jgi:uncharacterized heparinase superfamily protein
VEHRGERFEGVPAFYARAAGTVGSHLPLRAARQKLGLAKLAVERAHRGTVARVRRSRLVRWRHRAPVADDLALSPPDLQPLDPSFADEMESGSFGLAGLTVQLRGASPFEVAPHNATWARELHGFAWLRHLDAVRTLDNEMTARRLVGTWIRRAGKWPAFAWAPEVAARRMISWLSHAGLILEGADRRPYAAFMLSLEDHATYLSASWRNAPDGPARLLALIGLAQAALCIAGHEERLAQAEAQLVLELERQILPDGGHASRNPAVLVELLLDLLPLRQCFVARGMTPPDALQTAIDRMMAMLRRLRLGDGQLARFNGMGATERDVLATLLTYDKADLDLPSKILASGYARLARGASAIVMDVGTPPPMELAGQACGGCLAFEMSAERELLFVNAGAPAAAHQRHRATSRGPASHNTLVLNGQPSTLLVRGETTLHAAPGALPIRPLNRVTHRMQDAPDGGLVVAGKHDGYAERFGLVHTRVIALNASGTRLDGRDALAGAKSELRFSWDVPFAIHFHLHPRAGARLAADGSAEITLPSGACWRLSAAGAQLTIEESTHLAELIGPLQAQQIVLRGVCYGAADVTWTVQRIEVSETLDVSAQLAEVRALLADEAAPTAETVSTPPAAEAESAPEAEPGPRDNNE